MGALPRAGDADGAADLQIAQKSIDCYRWPRFRLSVLCLTMPLQGTPPHSHSTIPSGRNALIPKRQHDLRPKKNRIPIRQKLPPLNPNMNFDDPQFARFRRLSLSIGRFSTSSSARRRQKLAQKDRQRWRIADPSATKQSRRSQGSARSAARAFGDHRYEEWPSAGIRAVSFSFRLPASSKSRQERRAAKHERIAQADRPSYRRPSSNCIDAGFAGRSSRSKNTVNFTSPCGLRQCAQALNHRLRVGRARKNRGDA